MLCCRTSDSLATVKRVYVPGSSTLVGPMTFAESIDIAGDVAIQCRVDCFGPVSVSNSGLYCLGCIDAL